MNKLDKLQCLGAFMIILICTVCITAFAYFIKCPLRPLEYFPGLENYTDNDAGLNRSELTIIQCSPAESGATAGFLALALLLTCLLTVTEVKEKEIWRDECKARSAGSIGAGSDGL